MKPNKSLNKVYLTTSKVQPTGRIALGPAALKNLNAKVGDEIDIYFDPNSGILRLKKKQVEDEENEC